jgi:hypothetical protein
MLLSYPIRRFPLLLSVIVAALVVTLSLRALGKTGACSAWNAIYSAPITDSGDRMTIEFRGLGLVPDESPFVLTAIDASGKTLWRHKGVYWCAMGAHGCFVSLNYKATPKNGEERANWQAEHSLRIVALEPAPKSAAPDNAPSIIVVAGLSQAFYYYWHHEGLVIEQLSGGKAARKELGELTQAELGEDVGLISKTPSAFYFEKCKSAVEALPSE